jgi:hypothetical protein
MRIALAAVLPRRIRASTGGRAAARRGHSIDGLPQRLRIAVAGATLSASTSLFVASIEKVTSFSCRSFVPAAAVVVSARHGPRLEAANAALAGAVQGAPSRAQWRLTHMSVHLTLTPLARPSPVRASLTTRWVMATSVRALIKILIGMFAALQGTVVPSAAEQARPDAPPRSEASTMSAFIARLRQDAELRARFSQNPRAVMREHGIDPTPFNLPDRMDAAQVERLLSDLAGRAGPESSEPRRPDARPSIPAPVYGPPPGPPRRP